MKILLKCRFWFERSGMEPEILHLNKLPGDANAAGSQSLRGSSVPQLWLIIRIPWDVLALQFYGCGRWKTWPEYSVATPIKRWNLSLHVLNLSCLVTWFESKFRSVGLKRLCSFCLCFLGMIPPFYKEVQSNLLAERSREGELRYPCWQFQVTVRHGEHGPPSCHS